MDRKYQSVYHRKLDGYSFEEYLIMFVTCSIFLPYFCSLIAIVFVLCYLAYTHQLIKIIRKTPRAFFIFLFCMLSSQFQLIIKMIREWSSHSSCY